MGLQTARRTYSVTLLVASRFFEVSFIGSLEAQIGGCSLTEHVPS
jgi:hypothetical protein